MVKTLTEERVAAAEALELPPEVVVMVELVMKEGILVPYHVWAAAAVTLAFHS